VSSDLKGTTLPSTEISRAFMAQFELKKDTSGFHGPMVHKVTGESYQAMEARLAYEHKQRKENAN